MMPGQIKKGVAVWPRRPLHLMTCGNCLVWNNPAPDVLDHQQHQREDDMTAPAKPALPLYLVIAATSLALLAASPAPAQSADTSFFVTSNGPGKGGDLGGIEGADRHCQALAQAAGLGAKTFHAYLSTQGIDG